MTAGAHRRAHALRARDVRHRGVDGAAATATELADTRNRYYLAAEDEDGALLGWAGVMVDRRRAEILTVGVVPPRAAQGIGARLLAALLAEAVRARRRRGVPRGPRRQRGRPWLYEREGFVEVGLRRGYYDAGRVDAVVMRREL